MLLDRHALRGLKAGIFGLSLVPLAVLVGDICLDHLGADPVESLQIRTGKWALRFLLITLSLSPLKRLSGLGLFLKFRRMMGLFCFFYASLHGVIYLVIDQGLAWRYIRQDVAATPHLMLGILAFAGLLPLALTSTAGMVRRLGKNWLRLHRLVYPVAALVVAHFWMSVKADLGEPLAYASGVAFLLGFRLVRWAAGGEKKPWLFRHRTLPVGIGTSSGCGRIDKTRDQPKGP